MAMNLVPLSLAPDHEQAPRLLSPLSFQLPAVVTVALATMSTGTETPATCGFQLVLERRNEVEKKEKKKRNK